MQKSKLNAFGVWSYLFQKQLPFITPLEWNPLYLWLTRNKKPCGIPKGNIRQDILIFEAICTNAKIGLS